MDRLEIHANRMCLDLINNKFFDEQKVSFKGVKTQRELIKIRLAWWLLNMEGDILNEAPHYCFLLQVRVMEKFDKINELTPFENYK